MKNTEPYSFDQKGNLIEFDKNGLPLVTIGDKKDFPMDNKTVKMWLNHAFRQGLNTKRQHFNDLLSTVD